MPLDSHSGVSGAMPKRHSSRFLLRVQLAGNWEGLDTNAREAGRQLDRRQRRAVVEGEGTNVRSRLPEPA